MMSHRYGALSGLSGLCPDGKSLRRDEINKTAEPYSATVRSGGLNDLGKKGTVRAGALTAREHLGLLVDSYRRDKSLDLSVEGYGALSGLSGLCPDSKSQRREENK